MRIIKLYVQQTREQGIQVVKYAVSLDEKRYPKIGRFVSYVRKVCQLDDIPYDLTIDGFRIPNDDKSKILKENNVLKISQSNRRDYQIRSSQISDQNEHNVDQMRKSKKSKVEQKIQKLLRKQHLKKVEHSDSSNFSSDEDQSNSSESSSSDSSQEVRVKPAKKTKNVKEPSSSSSSSSSQQEQPFQQLRRKIDKQYQKDINESKRKNQPKPEIHKKTKVLQKVASSSSSSSSEEESEQALPVLGKKPQAANTPKNQNKISIGGQARQKNKTINNPNQNKKAFVNSHRKMINGSSSQSQPSQTPVKKGKIVPESQSKAKATKPQPSITIDKPKSEIKLPPALRNKQVKKNFDEYKQNQWISIEKQKLKRWQQQGNKNICQPNNKIRFKIVELDEQKFVPVKSGWITAEVKQISANGVVSLMKIEQQGRPYRQTFSVAQHNMDQLQLNRLLASKEQVDFFDRKTQQAQKAETLEEKNVDQIKDSKDVQPFNTNDKNSLQKFVCGQANYYFSDKNYNFDLFMQMHANRHPQKFLNLSILLNFPKIKKFLKDEDKLLEYLKSDEKYDQRNYQIDFENRLIRKKGLIKKQQPAKPIAEAAQEQPPVQEVGEINEQGQNSNE